MEPKTRLAAALMTCAVLLHCASDDGSPASGSSGGTVVPNDAAPANTGGAAGSSSSGTLTGGSAGAAGSGSVVGMGGQSADNDSGPGSSDAASDGASKEGSAGPCTSLFCEDFESGLDMGKWTLDVQGGTATVVTDRVAHGSSSLRVRINAQGDHAAIVRAAPAGLVTHLFGRAYFYLASASQTPPSPAHTVYFSAGDGLSKKHYEVGGYDKGWQMSYWFPGGENIAGGGMVPVNRWACVEWELDDAPMGIIRIFIDGTKNAEFTNAGGGGKFTAFQTLTFGMKYFQKVATDADLFLDDLAIDVKRVGCID